MSLHSLVSIGIPTYNRPELLENVLRSISNQTYKNIEVIVSDNATSGENKNKVESVIEKYKRLIPNLTFFPQKENLGAAENFRFVLRKASGKYFMWAADDDLFEPTYVELTAQALDKEPGTVAATLEAQYCDETKKFDFFPEGSPFYTFSSENVTDRILYILRHNYGNLLYSMYRLEILKEMDHIFVANEIPFLIQVAEHGNWRVINKIGFYKKTTVQTYTQAKWEITGGVLKGHFMVFVFQLSAIKSLFGYHRTALKNISTAVDGLEIAPQKKTYLKFRSALSIFSHYLYLLIGFKPQQSKVAE